MLLRRKVFFVWAVSTLSCTGRDGSWTSHSHHLNSDREVCGAAAPPRSSPVLSSPRNAGPPRTRGVENRICKQTKARGVSLSPPLSLPPDFLPRCKRNRKWEVSGWTARRRGRGSTGGRLGQGLDLGRGREGGEGLPAAAGAAGEQEREKIRGEEGGAKAEGERMEGAVLGKGDLRCSNTMLATQLMCFKNAGTPGGTSDKLPNTVPVTSPCAICASSGQYVINLYLNIPLLGCTFSKHTWKPLTVLYFSGSPH